MMTVPSAFTAFTVHTQELGPGSFMSKCLYRKSYIWGMISSMITGLCIHILKPHLAYRN